MDQDVKFILQIATYLPQQNAIMSIRLQYVAGQIYHA